MKDFHGELRTAIVEAIRKARGDMAAEFGSDSIHGFALCTDDNVMTLFAAVCTKSWVAEREPGYKGIGSIYVEWNQSAGDQHFETVSKIIQALADTESSNEEQRFESLTLALEDCRNEGLFESDTLLICGNTDGVGDLEVDAITRLNSPDAAARIAEDLVLTLPTAASDETAPANAESGRRKDSGISKLVSAVSQLFRSGSKRSAAMEIIPGRGVTRCEIGSPKESALEVFGKPKNVNGKYFEFPGMGVDVAWNRKKEVVLIVFFFRYEGYKSFNGKTREGIGEHSSLQQVLDTYGVPDRQDQGPTSSGTTYEHLYYDRLGLEINFRHSKLESIRVDPVIEPKQ
ncbi:DUF4303 domain-containing protein [Planctomycetes bacterium K23_9]|uniref:Uncharacterized protein n=1 Tax=Stieleria marina TaxID=1930275 RepID=A0A517NWG1_9BACT|nr:hypothetical protein K239x_34450 [Planctomycetes bacterium K23_9]